MDSIMWIKRLVKKKKIGERKKRKEEPAVVNNIYGACTCECVRGACVMRATLFSRMRSDGPRVRRLKLFQLSGPPHPPIPSVTCRCASGESLVAFFSLNCSHSIFEPFLIAFARSLLTFRASALSNAHFSTKM